MHPKLKLISLDINYANYVTTLNKVLLKRMKFSVKKVPLEAYWKIPYLKFLKLFWTLYNMQEKLFFEKIK